MVPTRRPRSDAVRNRQAILRATEALLSRSRPEAISMERVAAEAGVGKGTVFHHFGSRMGLMLALVQSRAHALLDSVMDGPPPLGPGAPPQDRLHAFLGAVVSVVASNKGLLAGLGHAVTTAQRPEGTSLEEHPVYRSWHTHIVDLLTELGVTADADLTAHVLLAPLNSEPIVLLLENGHAERLTATLCVLVDGLIVS